VFATRLKFHNLGRRERLGPAEFDPALFGLEDAFPLSFNPDLGFKLSNRPHHVEEQSSSDIAGVNALVDNPQIHMPALQLGRDVTQMQD